MQSRTHIPVDNVLLVQIIQRAGNVPRHREALHPNAMEHVRSPAAIPNARSEPIAHIDANIFAPNFQLVVQRGHEPVEDDEVSRFEGIGVGVPPQREDVGVGEAGGGAD